jgi:hypothetical protein
MAKKKRGKPKKKLPTVRGLQRELRVFKSQVVSVLPLHLKAASDTPLTGMRKVGLAVQDGAPDVVNAWVEDELVLHAGKRQGESRPRPIGEIITLTVEVIGDPGQLFKITLTHTDRTPFADRVPDSGHYEGGNQYTVT